MGDASSFASRHRRHDQNSGQELVHFAQLTRIDKARYNSSTASTHMTTTFLTAFAAQILYSLLHFVRSPRASSAFSSALQAPPP